jgi:multiple sugar transport system permease protein
LPYLLLLPLFLCIGVFIYRSVLMSLGLSTLEYTLGSAQSRFIGLDNYIQLFNKAEFWRALGNSAVYTLVGGGISIGLGLALAIAVRKVVQLTAIWQVAFFLPVTATLAAMSVVWKHIFNPTVGALNAIVQSLGLPPQSWLQNDLSAMVALIGVGVWSSAGYAMVLFLAGLTQIPRDLYQAAQLDGANGWQQLRFLTLPLLGPTTLFVVIIITLRFLENFDTFRVLTDGGPLGATTVLSLYLFQNGFQFFNTGYASAIAMIFFVILIGLTQAQMRSERQVHY